LDIKYIFYLSLHKGVINIYQRDKYLYRLFEIINIYQFLGISDLGEEESDMEEMEHPQTKLSRVARWAENENMEVFCSFLFRN
jgi:hypothetical protein